MGADQPGRAGGESGGWECRRTAGGESGGDAGGEAIGGWYDFVRCGMGSLDLSVGRWSLSERHVRDAFGFQPSITGASGFEIHWDRRVGNTRLDFFFGQSSDGL
jgi:hypothetical protein